ncbi:LytR/AlgR family response regulator transcription factor [Chryseobacterium gossypii]|uniref:LytR/AlgR family response regulator transcription factor n=1 Tax=Chryseobacterium gossypii TaxID=3231602 RepID=UPI0035254B01
MNPLNCIIVDDEDGAHLVIEHHLNGLKSLNLCGNFFNAKDAMDYLYKNSVDLIFLDINMPGLTGMEMLATMNQAPLVILTTAYSEFALESYKYQVVDYLVKPISLLNFLSAVDKAISRLKPSNFSPIPEKLALSNERITLKIDGDYHRINPNEIIYIQSWGNYVKVFTGDKFLLTPITTNELEQKLDASKFVRIHKSYIVALNQIKKIAGNKLYLMDERAIPIGITYRKQLLALL